MGDAPTRGMVAQPRAGARLIPATATGGFHRSSGVLDRTSDATGPLAEPAWWSSGSSDQPAHRLSARHSSDDRPGSWAARPSGDPPANTPRKEQHPSAPLPPLPTGAWDRLRPRDLADRAGSSDGYGPDDDTATVATPRAADGPPPVPRNAGQHDDADDGAAPHRPDPHVWEDQTGGLEVIGEHVAEDGSRRRWWRRARHAGRPESHPDAVRHVGDPHVDDHPYVDERRDAEAAGPHGTDRDLRDEQGHGHDEHGYHEHGYHEHGYDEHGHDEHGYDEPGHDDDIPLAPYDSRSVTKSRRPWAVLLTLLVLGGLVAGIVVGGEKLWTMVNPASADFSGRGTGAVDVRINQGDTLSDIARTLVEGGVIASVGPFIDAAEADPASTGIQPGVYRMREEMSGQAAVDLLLDPATRMVTRVTLPEGLTVKATLAKLAETSGTPLPELEAAAANPAALGLPAYAGGKLEGFLFPATYDFEPDTTPVDMLSQMVDRAVHALDELQIPEGDRLTVLTKASLVQAEASTAQDMAKVARVLENRLADGMPLQLDSTVNYANGKSGITTTPADRANPSPYNTYMHPGLTPGAINNPGEEALRAVLAPADGEWRFFVVVDPDTGDTRFAVTGAEHEKNVLLFQEWLREQPGG